VLTPKEQQFVAEYPIDLNGAAAAVRAGYAAKSAKVTASRLLKKPAIKAALQDKVTQHVAAVAEATKTTDLSAARVLEELRRLAFCDIRGLFNANGDLKPLADLTEEQAACIGGFEVLIKNAKAGDGVTDTIHKFKLWDKPKALEMLAKHFALLVERVEVIDEAGLLDKIAKARARLTKK
jgi:phage terminase small subunit